MVKSPVVVLLLVVVAAWILYFNSSLDYVQDCPEVESDHTLISHTPERYAEQMLSKLPHTPAMTRDEVELLVKVLYKAHSYFEYGVGGSTHIAVASPSVAHIHSVDSSSEWIAILRQDPLFLEAEESHRVALHHVDIGPVARWGKPSNFSEEYVAKFPDYPGAIRTIMATLPEEQQADVILIDGRFRVACALTSFLVRGRDAIVLIHDFFAEGRVSYHIVTKFADIIAHTDTLVVLQLKKDADMAKIESLLKKYETDPS